MQTQTSKCHCGQPFDSSDHCPVCFCEHFERVCDFSTNGWTFDPSREVWWAKIGPSTWREVKGAFDDPPSWRPESI